MNPNQQPSDESVTALVALKSAVAKVFERKMKLGQFVAIWKNGKAISAHLLSQSLMNSERLTDADFQMFLLDSPEMTDEEFQAIEEKRRHLQHLNDADIEQASGISKAAHDVSLEQMEHKKRNTVILGVMAEAFAIPDDFDKPLPENLINEFYTDNL